MGCTSPCLNISFAAIYATTGIRALMASHLMLDNLRLAKKNVISNNKEKLVKLYQV